MPPVALVTRLRLRYTIIMNGRIRLTKKPRSPINIPDRSISPARLRRMGNMNKMFRAGHSPELWLGAPPPVLPECRIRMHGSVQQVPYPENIFVQRNFLIPVCSDAAGIFCGSPQARVLRFSTRYSPCDLPPHQEQIAGFGDGEPQQEAESQQERRTPLDGFAR